MEDDYVKDEVYLYYLRVLLANCYNVVYLLLYIFRGHDSCEDSSGMVLTYSLSIEEDVFYNRVVFYNAI